MKNEMVYRALHGVASIVGALAHSVKGAQRLELERLHTLIIEAAGVFQ